MSSHMTLQVYLGWSLDSQDGRMEDGEIRDSFTGNIQPCLDISLCCVVQLSQVRLVNVVHRQVEPHGREDVSGVLTSHLCFVQVRQFLLQFGVKEGEVVSRGVAMGECGTKEFSRVIL